MCGLVAGSSRSFSLFLHVEDKIIRGPDSGGAQPVTRPVMAEGQAIDVVCCLALKTAIEMLEAGDLEPFMTRPR